ncbi:interleukin-21 receptor [Trachemys scripta elegans]|uniref:interleukin-21 receptor n=1 Tax=Trachemys scripta elegans TaxID=31138 RepID=UPI00155390F6|nr:interleukin-21 receptor [Trachemys scripta elegans]
MRQGQPTGINMRNKLQLQAIPFFLLLQYTTCCEDLLCSVDYVQTLTCVQKTDLSETLYNLTATWLPEEEMKISEHFCNFHQSSRTATHTQYTCFMDLKDFNSDDKFRVDVTKLADGQYTTSKACSEFLLSKNSNGSLQGKSCVQTCLATNSNQKSKVIPEDERSVVLLPLEFQRGTDYEFQVRAKPRPGSDYVGVWSEWSSLLTLKTEPEESPGVRWLVSLLAFALVAVSVTVFLTKHQSIWKKLGVFIPDPAPFFKPLYVVHNGDFKKWVGASCTKATLDFFEWGIVLPEVLEVYSKHLSHNTAAEELKELNKDHPRKTCVSCLAMHGQDSQSHLSSLNSSSGIQDQSYGHLSIDTVTVADEFTPCYSQCNCNNAHRDHEHLDADGEDGYPKVNLDGDNSEISSSLPLAALSAQDNIISSGSVSMEHSWRNASPSVHHLMAEALGGGMGSILEALCLHHEQWDLESPASLPSPDGESVSYSDGPYDFFSPNTRTGDGYPAICLDLDTIDSGFVDSDCGSPIECEFEKSSQTNSGCSSGSITLENEGEDFPRSYVKQWVSCRSATPPTGTQTN